MEIPLHDSGGEDWRQLYQDALFEADLSKLEERIELASNAVQARLRDLAREGGDAGQRDILMDALRTMQALRRFRP